ncbi:hypothetical protein [Microvirga mediterraneensis]|uniref:Uncharacterized protein n=1 Tax=Microvirga mediterraneensis TaxID=2754695 RepID=A0A838BTN6_9HYPH|nr:hypothetical protein [Microvirga mediterraneensis]MBA1157796.1 hypothetical protein [Microvirga mediterraneensis]
MADVIAFPRHLRVVCSEVTEARTTALTAFFRDVLPACPCCHGRGVFLFRDPVTRLPDHAPCPCGGTDEDRIDLNDFGGAA